MLLPFISSFSLAANPDIKIQKQNLENTFKSNHFFCFGTSSDKSVELAIFIFIFDLNSYLQLSVLVQRVHSTYWSQKKNHASRQWSALKSYTKSLRSYL